MISNLASARALIQADLDHARSVLALWTDQVSELEKALEQISLVDNSRTALRGASQAQQGSLQGLAAGNGANGKARRGRKPKQALPGAAKYRDPNSNKTWTGHGRRPGWVVGAPEQYAIDDQAGPQVATAGKNSGADTAAMADAYA